MDTEAALKRIRTQIKYGRTEGVEEKLEELIKAAQSVQEEISVLEVAALEYWPGVEGYAQAIPKIERLLKLNPAELVKTRALALLNDFKAKVAVNPSNICLDGEDFLKCMEKIHEKDFFYFSINFESMPEYELIRNLDEAKKLAWHKNTEKSYKSWNELRAKASSQINAYCSENKINVIPIRKYEKKIELLCDENLSPTMMNFYDDISGDLSRIIFGKALGVVTTLHSKMWEAYQKKVFPCGWKGEFPAGTLCVFAP